MKKLTLAVIGMYVSMLSAFSQSGGKTDSAYKSRRLTFDEANIVSSYYSQDGNNAAVTGGTGSQKLTDLSNAIDLRLIKYDKKNRKHSYSVELGIDHYTSASSDKIDPKTISSVSYSDNRIYPSLNWSMENETTGKTVGAGLYYSSEFDYQSIGGNIHAERKTKDRSGELGIKLQAYLDKVTLIYPVELRQTNLKSEGTASRNTFSATFSWSQIVNKNFQVMLEGEAVYQDGYLGLPFNRVYFSDNSVHVEKLPNTRIKVPLGVRANYFLGDAIILRGWYRYYTDSWNIHSHTMQLETTVKINPFFSVTPFYRFYHQTAVDYFAPYRVHTIADVYYSSNYDLSAFNSNFYGAGVRVAPPKGVFGIQKLNALELRYGHYQKTYDMNANIISLHIKMK